jgi:hypothetical protein
MAEGSAQGTHCSDEVPGFLNEWEDELSKANTTQIHWCFAVGLRLSTSPSMD